MALLVLVVGIVDATGPDTWWVSCQWEKDVLDLDGFGRSALDAMRSNDCDGCNRVVKVV